MSRPKSSARQSVVQALYQWQMTGENLEEIQRQFETNPDSEKYHKGYFEALLFGVVDQLGELDSLICEFADRNLEKMDPIEKAILRIGAYELTAKPEVPFRVVINECVNLAKRFGSDKSHAYVNSILDKISKKTRPLESKPKKRS
jgi:N utilization substance protein B